MGFFGKILPWKRKDDLGLNDNLGIGGAGGDAGLGGLGLGGMPYEQPGASQYPPQFGGFGAGQSRPQMEAFQQNQAYERSFAAGKDIEVVSAKLDAVKSALEALNQRLANIERYLQTEQEFKKRGGW